MVFFHQAKISLLTYLCGIKHLDKLYARKYLDNANAGEKTLRYLLPILQQVELSAEAYYEIVEHCRRRGLTFMCSGCLMFGRYVPLQTLRNWAANWPLKRGSLPRGL